MHDVGASVYLELYLLDKFGKVADQAFEKVRTVQKVEEPNVTIPQLEVVEGEADDEDTVIMDDDFVVPPVGDNEVGAEPVLQTEISICWSSELSS